MTLHAPDTVASEQQPPARVALVSDVHGNLPALRAVMAEIERAEVDETWCLGDVVGYGAQPDGCVAMVAERCSLCLLGNHDLAVLDRLDIAEFSPAAARAALWTRRRLSADAAAWLTSLPTHDESRPIGLYHASPRDPIWEYVVSTAVAAAAMDAMGPRVGAVGHSHVALCFYREADGLPSGLRTPADTDVDLSTGRWLINPGAVGQPRDGDPRAAWLLLDLGRWAATWRRVDYPIDEAAEAIRETDLPPALADRLYYGQ